MNDPVVNLTVWDYLAIGLLFLVAALCLLLMCNRPAYAAPQLTRVVMASERVPGSAPEWRHPLLTWLGKWGNGTVLRGKLTGDLYRQAVSGDVPIRTWYFTGFHPDEGPIGGGHWTRNGHEVKPGIAACSLEHKEWLGHELFVSGYGRAWVDDTGGGWSQKFRFDLCTWTVKQAHEWSEERRCVVIYCPHPATCFCDRAVAWRKARGRD